MIRKILVISTITFGLLTNAAIAQDKPNSPTLVSAKEMPSGTYKSDKNHTSITWKVSHMGMSKYTARFTKIDATLVYDAKDPSKSKVTATIDPTSIRTDYPDAAKKDFDKELSEVEGWFNAKKFPEIKFESTKIEMTGKNKGRIHGNLTLLGVTKPVALNVIFNGGYTKMPMLEIPAMGFSATTIIRRSDFNWSTYIPLIGDDVSVMIETEFHKK